MTIQSKTAPKETERTFDRKMFKSIEEPETPKAGFLDPKAGGWRGNLSIIVLFVLVPIQALLASVRNRYQSLTPKQRNILFAQALILVSVFFFGIAVFLAINILQEEDVAPPAPPELEAALQAPFGLANKPISAQVAQLKKINGYTLQAENVTYQEGDVAPNNLLTCLGGSTRETCTTMVTVPKLDVRVLRYQNRDGERLDIVRAVYANPDNARVAMLQLASLARMEGRVDRFALDGLAEVDYFFSYSDGWFSFTWAQDRWITSVASRDLDDLYDAMEVLAKY